MNGGDALARGAKSANFPASDGKVTQERWDEIFGARESDAASKPQDSSDEPIVDKQ